MKTCIVPVTIESNPTSYISVRDLNVDHWLADRSDGESFKPGEPYAHAFTAWLKGRVKEQNTQFVIHTCRKSPRLPLQTRRSWWHQGEQSGTGTET
jgi:hypothetical protein